MLSVGYDVDKRDSRSRLLDAHLKRVCIRDSFAPVSLVIYLIILVYGLNCFYTEYEKASNISHLVTPVSVDF